VRSGQPVRSAHGERRGRKYNARHPIDGGFREKVPEALTIFCGRVKIARTEISEVTGRDNKRLIRPRPGSLPKCGDFRNLMS
jgi:hypothetical protein